MTPVAGLPSVSPEALDFSGHTLFPGLIDSHVHLFMSASCDPVVRARQLDAPFAEIRPVIDRHLRQHLACGVVAVRDGGDRQGHALGFKRLGETENRVPLILRAAGKAWHRPGRYGRLIGRSPGETDTLADAVGRDREGGDHVKIVNSGLNSLVAFGRETRPQFDLPELRAAVATAQRSRRPVMVHANGRHPVAIAVEAGCSSVEHGFFMGRDTLQRMADRGTIWVPTAATMQAYAEHYAGSGPERDVARRNLEHQLAQIDLARRLGVTVALGTDAGSLGVLHGNGVAREIRLLLDAGFSLPEAVRSASLTGARLLNLPDLGLLAPGKAATFVAVAGAPEALPESLEHIAAVYVGGRRMGVHPEMALWGDFGVGHAG